VIAGGVETDEQQEIPVDLGCRLAQGWLDAPALPSDELTRRLLAGQPSSPTR
jgi:EAL domain-containing protein (putative c-di-GMP-specific phosphodiesterase class I)